MLREDVSDIAEVAARTIRDEDFVCLHRYSVPLIVEVGNPLAQPFGTLLQSVAVECACVRLVIYRLVESVNHHGRERTLHIADSETEDMLVGVLLLISACAVYHFREEVGCTQFAEICVDIHCVT